jgi:hypothetical protein
MHSEHQQLIEINGQVQDSTTSPPRVTETGTHQTGASVGSNSNCKHRITYKCNNRSLNKFQISTHYDLSIIITKTDYFHSIHKIL